MVCSPRCRRRRATDVENSPPYTKTLCCTRHLNQKHLFGAAFVVGAPHGRVVDHASLSAIVSGPSRISTVTGKRPRALTRPRTTAALPLYLGLGFEALDDDLVADGERRLEALELVDERDARRERLGRRAAVRLRLVAAVVA